MFKKDIDAGNVEEMDDSTEITTISASNALKSLENVRLFLLQQDDTDGWTDKIVKQSWKIC